MGCFAILPNSESEKTSFLKQTILKRGFPEIKEIKSLEHTVFYAPKMSGISQFHSDSIGISLITIGTLWYKNQSLERISDQLLVDYSQHNLNHSDLSGTFTLLFIQQDKIEIYHDMYSVNRFYIDQKTGIISSSWLSLALLQERREFDKEAILENLLMGFNLGTKTWLKNIQRIKHQEQLPASICYHRNITGFPKRTFRNRKEAITLAASIFSYSINQKLKSKNKVIMGLSSGYDSRLVCASLQEENIEKIRFFTFHKPGDRDPEIAHQIVKVLNKDLRIEKTESLPDEDKLKDIYQSAFEFFDGQCADMMQYSKEDYTKAFRDKMFSKDELHLSGVGGEMYRNHQNDHRFSINYNHWVNHYFNGGRLTENDDYYKSVIKTIEKEVKSSLKIEGSKISYQQRRRFYAEIFLSDWYGLRNSVENQYMNYYSAFTDTALINFSKDINKFLGVDGRFEAEMITKLSPELARLSSEYGHTFDQYPIKTQFLSLLKTFSKTPILGKFRHLSRQKNTLPKLNPFEKDLVESFKANIQLPEAELQRYLKTQKSQFLAACYILKTLA